MDRNQEKRRMVERYERAQRKHGRTREERKELEAEARRRKAKPVRRKGVRRRGRDGEDDANEVFEKIPAAPRGFRKQASRVRPGLPEERARGDGVTAALVVAVHRDRTVVRVEGERLGQEASLGGDQPSLAVGDRVYVAECEGTPPRLDSIAPRDTVLSRPDPLDPRHELVLAANVEIGVIVTAARRPGFRPALVDRVLVALQRGGVEPLLCVNKVDLLEERPGAKDGRDELDRDLAPYRELGLDVHLTSTVSGAGLDDLRASVAGSTCVFVGHSGVGKSTLLNAIDPGGRRETGAGRTYDGKGRHTTSSSQLVELADGTRLIDTPGVRAFGLVDVERSTLRFSFAEFGPLAPRCKFSDCLHDAEPDCAVRAAAESGRISRARFATYLRILRTLD